MQLNNFDGGLNDRLAPHLINANEGTIYTNIDSTSMSLKPLKKDINIGDTVYPYMWNFKDNWVSSASYRTYQEFQEKLYYTDGVGLPQKSSDGITWQNLGIRLPDSKPTVTIGDAGVLEGTLQYCYTYYNNIDGTESQPSIYSDEVIVELKKTNISLVASTDSQVTHIRLYRVGGNLTAMQLVISLDNETVTYEDNIKDIDISGEVLNSFNYKQAPEGLSYLTENNAMLFGVLEDKLYYSDVAFVNNWSAFNFIDFDSTITGIGAVPNGLLVFTKYKTYIVTGTSPVTLSKYLLSSSQGCLEHRTISFASNTLIWLSSDGICVSNGGEIVVISRDKLGKLSLSNIKDSIVYDDIYYIGYQDGILIADFRFGTIFRHLDTSAEGFHIYNDRLYFSKSDILYSLGDDSESRSIHYKSPKLSDGQISNLKNYKSIYVKCDGTLEVKVSIDGTLVTTKSINSDTNEILIPQASRQGYYIEFEITGTGELLEIQYKIEGRQNGR